MKIQRRDVYGNTTSYVSMPESDKIISLIKYIVMGIVMIVAIVLEGGAGLMFDGIVLGGIWLLQIIREGL